MSNEGWTDIRTISGYLIGTPDGTYVTISFLKRFYPGTTSVAASIGDQVGVALFDSEPAARKNAEKVAEAMAGGGFAVELALIQVEMREQMRVVERPVSQVGSRI